MTYKLYREKDIFALYLVVHTRLFIQRNLSK